MFADRAKISIRSGKGGNGHCSFRRELYVANGGPDGGDGGKGGDLIFEVDEGLNTLVDYRHKRKYAAGDGEEGDRLARGVLIEQRLDAGELIGEDALGLLGFAQQQADAFDPLHPGQRAALVAGALHKDGHAKFFQLLLDLGGVVDHSVLDGKAAVRSEDALVIRGAVLARIGDLP